MRTLTRGLMRNSVGIGILAAAGIAWCVYAIRAGLQAGSITCGALAIGFVVVALGLRGTPRPKLVAAGFGIEAVVAAFEWPLYGGDPGADLPTLWAVVSIVGFALAAYGALRSSTLAVRVGIGAIIPFALANISKEFGGHLTPWSPGNVLFLVGIAWVALVWDAPQAARPAEGPAGDVA